jgi:hypothetical protein
MERPPLRGATGWQRQDVKPPDWHGKPATPAPGGGTAVKTHAGFSGFDRFRGPVARGGRVDNTAAYMREIEQMRKLVDDDSWMDGLSRQELIQIRDRARQLAAGLTKVQDQLKPFKR